MVSLPPPTNPSTSSTSNSSYLFGLYIGGSIAFALGLGAGLLPFVAGLPAFHPKDPTAVHLQELGHTELSWQTTTWQPFLAT